MPAFVVVGAFVPIFPFPVAAMPFLMVMRTFMTLFMPMAAVPLFLSFAMAMAALMFLLHNLFLLLFLYFFLDHAPDPVPGFLLVDLDQVLDQQVVFGNGTCLFQKITRLI